MRAFSSDESLGVFDFDNDAEVEGLLRRLKRRSGRGEVIVRKYRARRSPAQNRYWWGVVIPHMTLCWACSHDDAHDRVCLEFLPNAREVGGTTIVTPGSTSDLDTLQFNKLIEAVSQYAALEHGVYIPLPNEWPDEEKILV